MISSFMTSTLSVCPRTIWQSTAARSSRGETPPRESDHTTPFRGWVDRRVWNVSSARTPETEQ